MSEFDTFNDGAFQLKQEGEKISLSFKRGVPTTGQGTVQWNIPTPSQGCSSNSQGVYSGILILLSTTPLDASNIPVDSTTYYADPTANFDLHVGDRIGNALVVGALYECEKKGTETTFTTSLVISDLQPNTPYYIGGYAVDCQFRYHKEGIRAYSDKYGSKDNSDISAKQVIAISSDRSSCILPTDGTGLTAGITYQFDVIVDDTYPNKTNVKTAQIAIDGIDAGTYQQLLDRINNQLKLIDNPLQSPIAPNTGALYWNNATQKLYQFNGTTHSELSVIVKSTDPIIVVTNEYWFNTETTMLYQWDTIIPSAWNDVDYISTSYDPTNPVDNAIWFDQTTARMWNGVSWCDLITIVSADDPDACLIPTADAYWFDEANSVLYGWNTFNQRWEEKSAISWTEAPNQLLVGTYWFDLNTNHLFEAVAGSPVWSDITIPTYIQETTPIGPSDQALWYTPSTEELQQWNNATSEWVALPVLVWAGDPSDVTSCELWWRTTDGSLFIWDNVNSEWDAITNFTISIYDPIQVIPLDPNTIWYNPTTTQLNQYDGGAWVLMEYINKATDPTIPATNDVWLNTSSNSWNVWGTPTVGQWNEFDPIDSVSDPTSLATGTYWYDTSLNTLSVRNGISWISVMISTSPLTPQRETKWYDSTNDVLYQWSGSSWEEATPVAFAYFNSCGITFETTQKGSNTIILIPGPDGFTSGVCYGTGYADKSDAGLLAPSSSCVYSGGNGTVTYQARTIPTSVFLWGNVSPLAEIRYPQGGADGKLGTPSYDVIGVGTDGTPDERRELINSVRYQLGYPTVEVELTQTQLDTAVQKALETFRQNSSMAYKRGFYFLDIKPQQQHYQLTNRTIGYHKIVNISSAHRFTSAFLSTAHGGGVYGQVVLQHLYNMGTYDLTSYHLISQYVEQLEHLFATRLVYSWDENSRLLSFFQSFTRNERVLLDCSTERTEQDLLTDRYIKSWLEKFALAESMMMLAQIRGKYASLPGAGGGISLNASDLMATAENYKTDLMAQLEDYVVQGPEDFGMGSTFIIG